jgi:hypothetical protein
LIIAAKFDVIKGNGDVDKGMSGRWRSAILVLFAGMAMGCIYLKSAVLIIRQGGILARQFCLLPGSKTDLKLMRTNQ